MKVPKIFNISILLFFVLFFNTAVQAQDAKTIALAKQYYQKGDFEKSAELFEELWKSDSDNQYYYSSLFNSLLKINEYDKLESIVKKQQKKFKEEIQYKIDLGYVYSQNNEAGKAQKEYEEVLEELQDDESEIRTVANKFTSYRENDLVIETYKKGNKLLKSDTKFAYELGYAYLKANKIKEAIENWLLLLDENEQSLSRVQSIMTRYVDTEGLQDELETQLYSAIQKNSNTQVYPEMLIWLFTQQGDFEMALIQAKAIDKRNEEDGGRIIQLAYNAMNEKAYKAAENAYEYVLKKGEMSRFYRTAKTELLKAKKLKITNTSDYTEEDINSLKQLYKDYLNSYGYSSQSANTVRELANLEANYLYNLDEAIRLLTKLIETPGLNRTNKNEAKLELGDYYILRDEVWEATLLYAQVDKAEKDSPLGEEARYRNAKLSYYKGEFEWAQAQLNILKGATTELIANDALNLSVFIIDNLGLDTSTQAMEMYSKAELYIIQNKKNEALELFDNMQFKFPDHQLTDNILFEKAKIYFSKNKYDEAIIELEKLVNGFGDDILADNAIFMLGDIYENYLSNPEKAMEYYKKIITDYSDSVLVVNARKRFRKLRGDDV